MNMKEIKKLSLSETKKKGKEYCALSRQLSERLKCFELMNQSYEELVDEYDADKMKNTNHVKELQREIYKLTRMVKGLKSTVYNLCDAKKHMTRKRNRRKQKGTTDGQDEEGSEGDETLEQFVEIPPGYVVPKRPDKLSPIPESPEYSLNEADY